MEARQTSTTRIFSKFASLRSRTNRSITQNRIAPTTTVMSTWINTKTMTTSPVPNLGDNSSGYSQRCEGDASPRHNVLFQQAIEQSFVKVGGRLNLRRMAQVGELDKLRTRNARGGGFSENRIIAKRRADVWRRPV